MNDEEFHQQTIEALVCAYEVCTEEQMSILCYHCGIDFKRDVRRVPLTEGVNNVPS